MDQPDWIALDCSGPAWRSWAMDAGGAVLADATLETPPGTEPLVALPRLIGPWLSPSGPTPVIACGIDGRFRPVPCAPLGQPERLPQTDPRIALVAVPGLSQDRPSVDLMLGDETRIAGILSAAPDWDGIICLPGRHSRWVEVSAGEVVSFRSFLTGELFELLSTGPTLGLGSGDSGDDDALDAGVAEGLARPALLSARLFGLHAEQRLAGLSAVTARARLSGLLIGAELAAAKPWWLGRDVIVVGDAPQAASHARALAAQGVTARQVPAEAATLAGLRQARKTG